MRRFLGPTRPAQSASAAAATSPPTATAAAAPPAGIDATRDSIRDENEKGRSGERNGAEDGGARTLYEKKRKPDTTKARRDASRPARTGSMLCVPVLSRGTFAGSHRRRRFGKCSGIVINFLIAQVKNVKKREKMAA